MSALSEDTEVRAKVNQMSRRPVVHFPDGNLWELPGGNPSGGFMTKLMNTILTLIVLEYASFRFAETFGCEPECEIGAEGDDYIYSTDEVRFSPEWIRACGQELGLDYDANPLVEEEMTTTRLSKSSFCQRRYRLVRIGRKLVAITESDPTRMWGALLANRSSDPVVSKGIAHSLLVEHYWNESSRKLLRRYMRWLDERYGTKSKELTDRQIEKLHVSALELHARDPISLLALEKLSSKGSSANQWTLNDSAGFNSSSRVVENKRNMVKSKKAKAKRARRNAGGGGGQSIMRAVGVGPSGGNAQVAPSAYNREVMYRDAKFENIPGGIRITHSERIMANSYVYANGITREFDVHPRTLKFLGGIAEHYMNFRIRKFDARYAPKAATDIGQEVKIAPWYTSESSLKSQTTLTAGLPLVDLSVLPGSKQFAAWAENKVSWLAARAVRSTFKLFNIRGVRTNDASYVDNTDAEAKLPGKILVEGSSDGGTNAALGSIWIDYSVDLLDPVAPFFGGASFWSASTDGAALSLHTAKCSGDMDAFVAQGNTVTFLRPGTYTVCIVHFGSSPLPDADGHTITDGYGTAVTSLRWVPRYDVSDAAYVSTTNSSLAGYNAGASTASVQVFYVQMEVGDTLYIDDVTSGTISGTNVSITPGCPPTHFQA
jgi:hypothetical protein